MKLKFFTFQIFPIAFFAFCISSCGSSTDGNKKELSHDVVSKPMGVYVNSTVIENNDNKLIGYTPSYCLELNFLSQDSVMVYNGFEEYKLLATKEKDDLYNLKNASHKGDMYLKIVTDSTFLLIDSAWTAIKTPSLFKKAKGNLRFENYMNIKNIAGTYTLKNLVDSSIQNVEFTLQGKIGSCKEFNSYQLCFSGDCMNEPLEEVNTILLIGDMSSDTYAMLKEDKTNIIS